MGSFELGKEIEKDAFRLVTSVGQRKNFWAPRFDSSRELRNFHFVPRSRQDEKHLSLYFLSGADFQDFPEPVVFFPGISSPGKC